MQVVVPGDTDTYVLKQLTELTEYEVFLSAIYKDEAESETVSILETTCERSTLIHCLQTVLIHLVTLQQHTLRFTVI